MLRITQKVAADHAFSVPSVARYLLSRRHTPEDVREVEPSRDRQEDRPPKAPVDLHEIRESRLSIDFVFHHGGSCVAGRAHDPCGRVIKSIANAYAHRNRTRPAERVAFPDTAMSEQRDWLA